MIKEKGFNAAILKKVRDRFIKQKETIAVAESVTSGNIQLALSQAKDASKFYQGGITAYNLGQKYKHLNVEPIHAESCMCVSEKVAEEMALHVCTMFGSDYGIGITGFAAKMPEENINSLYAFLAIAHHGSILWKEKITAKEQESQEVQRHYTEKVIERLSTLMTPGKKQPNEKRRKKTSRG